MCGCPVQLIEQSHTNVHANLCLCEAVACPPSSKLLGSGVCRGFVYTGDCVEQLSSTEGNFHGGHPGVIVRACFVELIIDGELYQRPILSRANVGRRHIALQEVRVDVK